MRVSIVVSSYNYEAYVAQAIDSALAQTYPDVEVVIVDDGSTDGSPEIIRRYEVRAKLLFKPNGGQASAFNFAYPHCTGDAVLFLDCDDAIEPDAVAKSVAAWVPGCSKVHFPLEVIVEDGSRTGALVPRATLPVGNLAEQVLTEGVYVSPPNSGNLFSREFLDRVMPMPEREWSYGPDTYLIFLAPLYGPVCAVQSPLGSYRRHIRSLTNITAAGIAEVGAKLRPMAQSFVDLRELLEKQSAALGMKISSQAVAGHWLCLKVRFAMARVAPQLDPFGQASLFSLASRFLRSVWGSSELGFWDRMGMTVWTGLVGGLPSSGALLMIKFGFAPGERRKLFLCLFGLDSGKPSN